MDIKLNTSMSIDDMRQFLENEMKDCTVKHPWLNKRVLIVYKGAALVNVRIKNKRVAKIKGTLNTQNLAIVIPIAVGVVFGLIGGLIIGGLLWLFNSGGIKELEEAVVGKVMNIDSKGPIDNIMQDNDLLDDHLV